MGVVALVVVVPVLFVPVAGTEDGFAGVDDFMLSHAVKTKAAARARNANLA